MEVKATETCCIALLHSGVLVNVTALHPSKDEHFLLPNGSK